MMNNFSGHYNNWWCGPGAFVHGPFGMILTLIFWGAMLYLVIKLIQAVWPAKRNERGANLHILQQRYAKGEIDEATFARMKQELE